MKGKANKARDADPRKNLTRAIQNNVDSLGLNSKDRRRVREHAKLIQMDGPVEEDCKRLTSVLRRGNPEANELADDLEALMVDATDRPAEAKEDAREGTGDSSATTAVAVTDEPEMSLKPIASVSSIKSTTTHGLKIERYRKLLTKIKGFADDLGGSALRLRWELGKAAAEIVPDSADQPTRMRLFKKFASDLANTGGPGLSENSIREARRFYRKFSREQLERGIQIGLSIRNSLILCGDDVDDAVRDAVMKRMEGKIVGVEGVRWLVHDVQGTTAPVAVPDAEEETSECIHEMRNSLRTMERLSDRILKWHDLLTTVRDQGGPDALKQAERVHNEAQKSMQTMIDAWHEECASLAAIDAEYKVAG